MKNSSQTNLEIAQLQEVVVDLDEGNQEVFSGGTSFSGGDTLRTRLSAEGEAEGKIRGTLLLTLA
ncbi:hypothetical protein H6F98_13730 [Microcoleus sp. FACHB-SPT15]|uniref:hypothetical protein n=1 Tax=Microcoleus sp. FACHB-SPT15 TaxID=2692830 RepID=UPI00177DD93B|nr:hypothetical protein [Microcoleus sp. FACHB-SPT15]MBD1806506.1 hypothetical protein [Microcoleus sp. FACHB-SPT15]